MKLAAGCASPRSFTGSVWDHWECFQSKFHQPTRHVEIVLLQPISIRIHGMRYGIASVHIFTYRGQSTHHTCKATCGKVDFIRLGKVLLDAWRNRLTQRGQPECRCLRCCKVPIQEHHFEASGFTMKNCRTRDFPVSRNSVACSNRISWNHNWHLVQLEKSEAGATGGRANMQLEVRLAAEAQVTLTTSISTQCIWRKAIRLGAWQRLATLA